MSEYMCINHHLVRLRDTRCPICGEPKFYTDGMSPKMYDKFCRAEEEGDED